MKTREAGQLSYPPPLRMNLRLGEGTEALLALPLLRSACAIMREMVTMTSVSRMAAAVRVMMVLIMMVERDGNPSPKECG